MTQKKTEVIQFLLKRYEWSIMGLGKIKEHWGSKYRTITLIPHILVSAIQMVPPDIFVCCSDLDLNN